LKQILNYTVSIMINDYNSGIILLG